MRLSALGSSSGKVVIDQIVATYHVCGALPIMCELPIGAKYPYYPTYTFDSLVDIGLITIEEILHYAQTDGLRPYEWLHKVRCMQEEARQAGRKQ